MQQFTIIHFSQDFARGKAQLGGFGRILNICSDKHMHIIFTLSAQITKIEEYNIDSIKVIEIPIDKLPLSKKRQFFVYRKISLKIKEYLERNKIQADLLFGHSQLFNFYVLKELKNMFLPDLKILWEANAIWGISSMDNWKGRISNRLNRWFQHNIFLQANGIICHTNSSRDFIIKTFGAQAGKCNVITNGVLFEKAKAPELRMNELKKILCLGLFDKMNGIPFLADFIRNEKKTDGFEFHFIGDGLYKPIIEKLKEHGLCKYWGKLSHSEMLKKFSEFDFVIIPRLPCIEADLFIPTKLIESMYAGVVPICSDVNGMSEVIINAKNGFLFKAGSLKDLRVVLSNIKKLDSNEIEKIACNAQETVLKNYTWKSNHRELDLIYQKLILNN